MGAEDKLTIRYEVDDGYHGAGRPQSCVVFGDDFENDLTDEQIINRVYELLQEDMLQKVNPSIDTNMDEIVAWVRKAVDAA